MNVINPIARRYAVTLVDLVGRGLITVNSLHFIGFSMGAHMAGKVAREAKLLSPNFIVPRLTALDPPGPYKFPPNVNPDFQGLKKTDAAFVDAIHTDVLLCGSSETYGTVDFFPNNGVNPQPGCPRYIEDFLKEFPLSSE